MKKFLVCLAIIVGVFFTLKSAAESIIKNEYWVGDSANTTNLGTLDNPYDGSTEAKFDAIMSRMPQNATIHILAGTYETWGSFKWEMVNGQKILGSGRDNTILQLPAGTPQGGAGNCAIFSALPLTNSEVADLTVDCNWHGGGFTYSGINIDGTGNIIRRVRVIHCGYTLGVNTEASGIILGNHFLANSQGNIIEDCEVSEFAGGPAISAIGMATKSTNFMSGIIRNNVVLLPADPSVNAFGINGNWISGALIEGNYIFGAVNAIYSDTGGWTNTVIMNNTFKNCFRGVTIATVDGPLKNLTIAFNKIDLTALNNYNSIAFNFWGGMWTNIFIFGNTVDFYNTGSSPGFLIAAENVTGLVLENNFVDPMLASNQLNTTFFTNVFNFKIDDNYDLLGNYLYDLNVPMLGGVTVSPFGLTLINSGEASTALLNLGLPSNSPLVVTNHDSGITLSGSFSGDGSGLTGLNWNGIIGVPAFVQYSDPAPCFANGMNLSAGTAYQIGGANVLWCSNFNAGNLVVGYQSPAVIPNGIQNTVVGPSAMANSTNANDNTMVGTSAGRNLLSGSFDTMVGNDAGYVLKHGDDNTFIGFLSGVGNGNFTNSYQNTLIGDSSFYRAHNGTNNVALGYMAGGWLFSGNNNVFIAHQGTSSETNSNGAIYIGDPGVHTSAYIAGTVHASSGFAGNGNGLTNIPTSSLTGTVGASSLPFYIRAGTANFSGAGGVNVRFSTPVSDTNYVVTFGFESAGGTMSDIWCSGKTTNGFRAQQAGISLNSLAFDYIAVQRQ